MLRRLRRQDIDPHQRLHKALNDFRNPEAEPLGLCRRLVAALRPEDGDFVACRERYEAGLIGTRPPAAGWQIARLALAAAAARARRGRVLAAELAHAIRVGVLCALIAPLTWLVGLLLGVGRPNIRWRWDDLWQADLGNYDVVYAFLSPAPMPRLWEKVQAEMKPGSLFISNSFPVPGATPDQVIEVDCTPPRPLYCYQR